MSRKAADQGKPKPPKRRKKPVTPKSQIKSALRRLWLRSRERAEALRSTGNCCDACGVKASKAKGREVSLEVHHRDGIDWNGLTELIARRMLPPWDRLQPLCKACHHETHEGGKGE